MHSIQRYSLVLVVVSILAEKRYLLLVSAFFQHPSTQCVNISNSRVYNSDDRRQVAILLPDISNYIDLDSIDDNLKDSSDLQWHTDATRRLNEIANQFGLQQLSTIDESSIQSKERQIQHTNTHYLTAIPYSRTNSYALLISTLDQQSSSSNKSKRQKQTKKKKLKLTEPFYIDLHPPSDSSLGYRINNKQKNSGGSEMLVKALGIKKMISEKKMNFKEANDQEEVIVYDLTAGLGRDSLVILSSYLDYIDSSTSSNEYIPRLRVHMVERDPIVALLLNDAMRRLHQLASSNQIDNDERSKAQQITQCLSMEEGDGVTVLNRFMMLDKEKESAAADSSSDSITTSYIPSYPPDICYLDPMFPPRKKKSSAVKKDMAMLHSLLGTAVTSVVKEGEERDETTDRIHEEQALLMAAYNTAERRVVVKRPISALPIGLVDNSDDNSSTDGDNDRNIPKPSYDVRGSVNRFDVYIITR